jgi:hypothetical protein
MSKCECYCECENQMFDGECDDCCSCVTPRERLDVVLARLQVMAEELDIDLEEVICESNN